MVEADIDLLLLQRQLIEHFDLSELKNLCFDLHVDYDELAGETKSGKARELVKYCHRTGKIAALVTRCQELQPHVVWNQPAKIYRADELPDEWVDPLQRLHRLVNDFNRNRSLPFSDQRTHDGDEIAFSMRELAPFLFNQFDVARWLDSRSSGKRLAAIKYLDWLQDIEFLDTLLPKLATESPFMQLHILLTIDTLVDQMDNKHQNAVQAALTVYRVVAANDPSREYWRQRILARLKA